MMDYEIKFPSLTKVRQLRNGDFSPIKVDENSCFLLKKSVLLCAKYFQREGYSDWCHYDMEETGPICYLILCENYHAVGCFCFRKQEYKDTGIEFFTLHWAWLHPYIRNKGILKEMKPIFNKEFGYWYPQYPHSRAMAHCVKKMNLIEPSIQFKK